MPISLSGRNYLKLLDFTPDEIRYLISLAKQFKALKLAGTPHRYLEGKNIVLLFEKTSTRTRCSFEVAGHDLGLGVTYLDPGSSQMGKKESIEDTARVLGRMFDGIEYRGYGQEIVENLAAHAGVPVWNGLTNEFHPTQMIADMLTLEENFPEGIKGKKLVFMGDAENNVANSLMVVCAKLGLHFVACGPEERMPKADLVAICRELARESGGSVTLTSSVEEACTGADVVYTDIWVSMGEPAELWEERIKLLSPYQVNNRMIDLMAPTGIFMHCLPAFHDTETTIGAEIAERFGITEMEVTDEVFRGSRSRVFDEAENRMHSIKAIIYATLK
ncbi:MAG: ornithine carbamoyltransferase [Ellagibacter isourolithinifaciens]|uniref:ornithine carbamoyltransferase n=1 Tax=Ellagibacter isourolithinifaciens TaxID=2137581 RepID=UPI002A920BC4|nr:ornithine carbamoyltransferase [Ellagibacter isourolithinifaciens]MDY6111623.1 ornithine carbamoyltransferase [Ellagibacter isourolithinifaciens]